MFFIEANTDKITESRNKLSKYKSVRLTLSMVSRYKDKYSNLKHLRIDDNTKGSLFLDNSNVVAVINTEDKDGCIWIQALEVFKPYKGQGLSYGLLDYAVKEYKAKFLSVRKTNKIAIKLYENYGFKTYKTDDYMFYMKL